MKKKTMGPLLLCVMCLGLLTACGGKTLDMEDYITVTFSGYDTLGSPEVTVDWDGVSDKLFGRGGATVDPDHIIELDYENGNDLCNGENFTINVIIDEYDAERYEVTVKESQLTYKVEGLAEAKKWMYSSRLTYPSADLSRKARYPWKTRQLIPSCKM